MKKNSNKHSVLYLASMQTTRVLLVILILMTVAEFSVFYMTCTKIQTTDFNLRDVLYDSHVFWITRAGCFIYFAAMIITRLPLHGATPIYTLARLNETGRQQRIENYMYNLLCILVLWGSLILTYWGLYQVYVRTCHISFVGRQSLVLTINNTPFIHNFMPVCSVEGWITLIAIILGTPMMATEASRHMKGSSLFAAALFGLCILLLQEVLAGAVLIPLGIWLVTVIVSNVKLDRRHVIIREFDLEQYDEKGDPIEISISDKNE